MFLSTPLDASVSPASWLKFQSKCTRKKKTSQMGEHCSDLVSILHWRKMPNHKGWLTRKWVHENAEHAAEPSVLSEKNVILWLPNH